MNFLSPLLTPTILIPAFIFLALLVSIFSSYLVFKASKITQTSVKIILNIEEQLNLIEHRILIENLLSRGLINSTQSKNNIELCNILLSYCKYKSDVLTHQALENSLSTEIYNAVLAIENLKENRSVLEDKIQQVYAELDLKQPLAELEQIQLYAQALHQETQIEFTNTETMKVNVLKVNSVLDDVLLKLQ